MYLQPTPKLLGVRTKMRELGIEILQFSIRNFLEQDITTIVRSFRVIPVVFVGEVIITFTFCIEWTSTTEVAKVLATLASNTVTSTTLHDKTSAVGTETRASRTPMRTLPRINVPIAAFSAIEVWASCMGTTHIFSFGSRDIILQDNKLGVMLWTGFDPGGGKKSINKLSGHPATCKIGH